MDRELLDVQEVAALLKIARNTVYELIKRGELNCSKVGKQMRVSHAEVDAYLQRTMGKSASSTGLGQNDSSAGRKTQSSPSVREDLMRGTS